MVTQVKVPGGALLIVKATDGRGNKRTFFLCSISPLPSPQKAGNNLGGIVAQFKKNECGFFVPRTREILL